MITETSLWPPQCPDEKQNKKSWQKSLNQYKLAHQQPPQAPPLQLQPLHNDQLQGNSCRRSLMPSFTPASREKRSIPDPIDPGFFPTHTNHALLIFNFGHFGHTISSYHPPFFNFHIIFNRDSLKKNRCGWYCWWLKSFTSRYDKYPIVYRVSYIPGG